MPHRQPETGWTSGRGATDPVGNPNLDRYENLLLLCASDHSRVDQATDEFPEARLREIKAGHESWVRARLGGAGTSSVMIRRGMPGPLVEVTTGRELLGIVAEAEESSLDHEDLMTQEEVDLVGGFLQSLFDTTELWSDFEPALRTQAAFDLGRQLTSLHDRGWRVFAARSKGKLVGGALESPTSWVTAYVHVVRTDSPAIVKIPPPGV